MTLTAEVPETMLQILKAPRLAALGGQVDMFLLGGAAPLAGALWAEAGRLRVVVEADGELQTLWEGPCADQIEPPAFLHTEDGLLCAIPQGALLRVVSARNTGFPTVETVMEAGAPSQIGAGGGAVWGYWPGVGLRLLPLDQHEAAGVTIPLPERAVDRGALTFVATRDGDLVLFEDDNQEGFRAYCYNQDTSDWDVVVSHGAARHGYNATVFAAVPWGGGVAVAVGMASDLREQVFGLAVRGELLRITPRGHFDIAIGELRTSPAGLKVPTCGGANPLLRLEGHVSGLWPAGERVFGVFQMEDEFGDPEVLVFEANERGHVALLDETDAPILDIVSGPAGGVVALAGEPEF